MAIISIKEFAAMTGQEPKNIHRDAGRGKVIKTKEGRIDTYNELNATYLELRKHKAEDTAAKPKEQEAAPKRPVRGDFDGEPTGNDDNDLLESEKRYKKAAADHKEKLDTLAQIEIDKKRGLLINTEAVKMLFLQQRKTIIVTFRQFIEGVIEPFIIKYKLNKEDAAELRKVTTAQLNHAINNWQEEGKKGIQSLVDMVQEGKIEEAA